MGFLWIDGQSAMIVSQSEIKFPHPFGGVGAIFFGEFDPGSGRTLAACLTHASRTMNSQLAGGD